MRLPRTYTYLLDAAQLPWLEAFLKSLPGCEAGSMRVDADTARLDAVWKRGCGHSSWKRGRLIRIGGSLCAGQRIAGELAPGYAGSVENGGDAGGARWSQIERGTCSGQIDQRAELTRLATHEELGCIWQSKKRRASNQQETSQMG